MQYIRTAIVAIASLGINGTSIGDPFVIVTPEKLTPPDGQGHPGDNFGTSSATIYGECPGVIVGAPNHKTNGRVYTFRWCGSSFQTNILEASSPDDLHFGYSLDANGSDDGAELVVGAPGDASTEGKAHIYQWDGFNWAYPYEITASVHQHANRFGSSVAMSDDGNTCLVGAWGSDDNKGSAYIFGNSNGLGWVEEQVLHGDHIGDEFGSSVAIATDYSDDDAAYCCAIGAPSANNGQGKVYIYAFIPHKGEWVLNQALEPLEPTVVGFGESVDIAYTQDNEGNVVAWCVVGAPGWNAQAGSASIWAANGNTGQWDRIASIFAPDFDAGDKFGSSVTIVWDGEGDIPYFLVGAPGASKVYTCDWQGNIYGSQQGPESNENYGSCIAHKEQTLSFSVIGAPGTLHTPGAAYAYPSHSASGDIDNDGDVDADDLSALHDELGICKHDVNHNGTTDIDDLLLVIEGWNSLCP